MSMNAMGFSFFLSPLRRGAPDSLSDVIIRMFDTPSTGILMASQQVSRRDVVEAAYKSLAAGEGRGRVLLEADYLHESDWPEGVSIFNEGGRNRNNRLCLAALLRGGFRVRTDTVRSALQHSNFIAAATRGGGWSLLTSANLSEGSLRSHFNWGLTTENPAVAEALTDLFDQAWSGDFRKAQTELRFEHPDGGIFELGAGADGQALALLEKAVEQAQQEISFAFFNISKGADLVKVIKKAAQRGVKVTGIVDGDQCELSWDAVPELRDGKVDVRYYPGVLTGGNGRMHYKMATIDNKIAFLGTSNISAGAESSLELGVTFQSCPELPSFLDAEMKRMSRLARISPPLRTPKM